MNLSKLRRTLQRAQRKGDFVIEVQLIGTEHGGPVFKGGGISLVGEQGPELVKWGQNGWVTPAELSAKSFEPPSGDER